METLTQDNQTRPFWVPLTDSVIRCLHGWPVEGSVCPLCEPQILNGMGNGKAITQAELWGYSISVSPREADSE